MPISYSNRFQQPDAVAAYEADEYATDSYASRIWQLERPVLERILEKFRQMNSGPLRLLDFACGIGRVLAALEPLVDVMTSIRGARRYDFDPEVAVRMVTRKALEKHREA